MENTIKFFSQRAITIATYIGGPLAGGYLMQKNYEAIGQNEIGRKALFISLAATILLFGGISVLPEEVIDVIPNVLIPFIYTGAMYLLVDKYQGQQIREHKAAEGEFYSAWKAAGVGAISLLILMVAVFSVAFIAGDFDEPDYDAVRYDNEIDDFTRNETKALAVFDDFETAETEALTNALYDGIMLWQKNEQIIHGLNSIDNLPDELLEQNALLMEYSELRVKHFKLLLKTIEEDSEEYLLEIENINIEIERVIALI